MKINLMFFSLVPNVSFQSFAPGFVSRFLESHAVMLQGNAGLKPKEGEYTSRPWEWPINLRVSFFGMTLSIGAFSSLQIIFSSTVSVPFPKAVCLQLKMLSVWFLGPDEVLGWKN